MHTLYKFRRGTYNKGVIRRRTRCSRLITFQCSSFSPLSYLDRAQNRKALRPVQFLPRAFDSGARFRAPAVCGKESDGPRPPQSFSASAGRTRGPADRTGQGAGRRTPPQTPQTVQARAPHRMRRAGVFLTLHIRTRRAGVLLYIMSGMSVSSSCLVAPAPARGNRRWRRGRRAAFPCAAPRASGGAGSSLNGRRYRKAKHVPIFFIEKCLNSAGQRL